MESDKVVLVIIPFLRKESIDNWTDLKKYAHNILETNDGFYESILELHKRNELLRSMK